MDAVIVEFFDYREKSGAGESTDLTSLFSLEDRIETALLECGAGEFDGDEIAMDGSRGFLFMYGDSVETLYGAVRPVLLASPLMRGAHVRLRRGEPGQAGASEEIVILP